MHSCSLKKPVYIAATEFTFEETDEGFFVHSFLISNRVNMNNWMVTSDANIQDGKDFEGKPDILFVNEKGVRDHTTGKTKEESLKVQEPFRKGTIETVQGLDRGVKLTSVDKIEDPQTIAEIKSGKIKFVSPAIFPRSLEDVEIIRTGPNSHIHVIHRYHALHKAFVDDPAYGTLATLGPTCDGKAEDCMVRLQQVQAGIGDDEVAPIREIEFVKIKTSKCSKTGDLIFEMPAGDLSEEVSKCLSQKLSPGEEPTDQDLAICFSEARDKLNKNKAKASKQATAKSQIDHKSKSLQKMTLSETEVEEKIKKLETQGEEIKKALKGQEMTEEEKKKEEARKAQEEEKKKDEQMNSRKGKSGQEMTEEEKKEEARKAQEEEEKKEEEMTAKIASQLAEKIPLVEQYVAAKTAQKNLDEKGQTELRNTMLKASIDELKSKLDDIGPYAAMVKKDQNSSEIGYGSQFSGSTNYDKLSDDELAKKAGIDA